MTERGINMNGPVVPTMIYKIMRANEWQAAVGCGTFAGSVVDMNDGFIHFSTAAQAQETARRHFAGQSDLVLVAFDVAQLGPQLWWEPSRGGDLFPHLYAALNPADALWQQTLALDADRVPIIPPEVV